MGGSKIVLLKMTSYIPAWTVKLLKWRFTTHDPHILLESLFYWIPRLRAFCQARTVGLVSLTSIK